jgi:UDP-GlcNAc:undecaprenyl-phosphate/decaprenyl-phosphate GlcNAc-1-phosphate transferase
MVLDDVNGSHVAAAYLVLGAVVTLALGIALQPLVLKAMREAAVIDVPGPRSSHAVATPRGGGLAVVVAAAAGLFFIQTLISAAPDPDRPIWMDATVRAGQPIWTIMMAILLFAVIGLLEDIRGVPVPVRLAMQAGAGLVVALLLVPHGGVVAVLLVALWLTGYTNAFNFMDGINGISATHAALAGVLYATAGAAYGLPVLAVAGTVTAAAAVSFLPWNAGRARIFLGDVGSYGLGGLLGAVAVVAWDSGVPVELVVAPLALYLADTGWTLARRCYRGEPWYRPHRSHTYQRLTDLGWSHQRVTAVTAATSALVCGCALAAAGSELYTRIALDVLAVAVLVGYLAAPVLLRVRPTCEKRSSYA